MTKNIIITGGSQGSRFINRLIVNSAKELLEKGFCLVHQTGEKLYNETIYMYNECGIKKGDSLKIYPFIDNIGNLYDWADVIISRSGSGSVYDAIYSKRPTIFIPLKSAADNHQMFNALFAKNMGFAEIISEENACSEKLIACVEGIYINYSEIVSNIKDIKLVDSADIMLREMKVA